jgi:hypothetical protein
MLSRVSSRVALSIGVACLASVGLVLFPAAPSLGAGSKIGSTLKIPPNTSVSISGNTAALRSSGGLGVSGTYDCSCDGGTGTCTITHNGGDLGCSKNFDDTCTASCTLTTTQSGLSGGRRLIQ